MKHICLSPFAPAALLGASLLLGPCLVAGAASNQPLPAILESGFASWTKGGGIDAILMGWQRGGLMEGSGKASAQARLFNSLGSALGPYRSHETIQLKQISRASQIIYLSINFDRGVVYGRFLLYRGDKDWVVQNMDFSERPEAVMPWLALEVDRGAD